MKEIVYFLESPQKKIARYMRLRLAEQHA